MFEFFIIFTTVIRFNEIGEQNHYLQNRLHRDYSNSDFVLDLEASTKARHLETSMVSGCHPGNSIFRNSNVLLAHGLHDRKLLRKNIKHKMPFWWFVCNG